MDEAADRVVMGPERRSRVISDREKRVTAYHEAGHALAAQLLERADPVHKITIVPRGRALGYVMQFPDEDRVSVTRLALLDRIGVALAGRATEEIIFQDVTTGAQNDFQQATDIAMRMVTRWGMSDVLGKIAFSSSSESYLGEMEGSRNYSEETAKVIDTEVKAIIDEQYSRIIDMLQEQREVLESIVEILLERETLHADEFAALMRGETLPPLDMGDPLAKDTPAHTPAPKSDTPSKGPLLPPGMMPKPG